MKTSTGGCRVIFFVCYVLVTTPAYADSYDVDVSSGENLIANQLDHGSNTLNEVMPGVPDGTVLFKYNNATSNWISAAYSSDLGTWTPTNVTLSPGEGAFLQSPISFTLTFTGTPHVPVLPVTIPSGVCYLLSRQTNDVGSYENIVGAAPTNGATLYQWTGSNYSTNTFSTGGWSASDPSIAVGEAVWISPMGGAGPPASPYPIFTLQPANISVSQGANGTFTSSASGVPPLNYLWYDVTAGPPGIALVGQTQPNLVLTNVQPAQDGNSYQVVVANSYGTNISATAILSVVSGPPLIEQDLQPSYTFYAGDSFTLSVLAEGTEPLSYGWYHNTVPLADGGSITGSHSNVLTIADAQLSDSGSTYQLFVTNSFGTTPSQAAVITIVPLPSYNLNIQPGLYLIANQLDKGSNTLDEVMPNAPDGSVLSKYDNATRNWISATYSSALGQWSPTNVTLSPGDGAFFQSPTNFTLTFTGTPHVPVLPVTIPSGALYLLSRQTNDVGTYDNIVGTPPQDGAMVYQWTGSNYTSFTYSTGVWSPSAPMVAVGEAVWIGGQTNRPPPPYPTYSPVIVQQPANVTAAQGGSASFSVTAIGTGTLSYEWGVWCPPDDPRWPNCGCTPLASCSPDLPTLTLTNLSPDQTGGYYVIVSNVYGFATSQVATLTVSNPVGVAPIIIPGGFPGAGNVFTFSFQSLVGFIYEVQYKSSITGSWNLFQSLLATSTLTTVQDLLVPEGSRFYRVVSHGPLTGPLTAQEPPQAPAAQPVGSTSCNAAQDDSLPYLFSGEFHQQAKDLVINGRGLDFVWARNYRSTLGPNTLQGNGWDFSYNIRVVRNGPDFDVFNGSARKDTYHLQADGTYGADQLFCEGTLSSNVFTLKFPDSGTWTFLPFDGGVSQGNIASITDRNSNSLTFAYSTGGLLTNITEALGRSIQIGYNADGFISCVTDFAGRQVTYAYYQTGDTGGSFGDLKSVTSPAVTGTPNGNDFPAGKTITYTYSQGFADNHLNHKLLTITDAKGQTWLSNIYASTTNTTDFQYGRLLSQIRGDSNQVLNFFYTSQPPIPANSFAVTKAIVGDAMGNVSEYLFDYMNNLVRLRQFTGRAVPGIVSTETQNRPTAKLRSSDPDFFETTYAWNADSKPTQTVFPNGNSILNTYEIDVNPNVSRRFRANLRARTSLPGPLGGDQTAITETFVYDTTFGCGCGFNFVTQATDGRTNTTYHFYDQHGNRTNTIYPVISAFENFDYNQFGQLTAHVLPDNGSGYRRRDATLYYTNGPQNGYVRQQIVDSETLVLTTTYEHDLVGNVVRIVDPRGNDSTNIVNQLDQVVREISRAIVTSNGPVRYQRDFTFDANNNLTRADVQNLDENGLPAADPSLATANTYDTLNRVTSTTQDVGASRQIVTRDVYDANENLTLVVSGEAANGDQPNNVTSILYDERNLPFREIRAPGDSTQSTTQRDYDGNRNIIRAIQGTEDNAAPRLTTYANDGYNRRISLTDAMGNVSTTHYDPNGNVLSRQLDGELVDLLGSAGNVRLTQVNYSYDPLNRSVQTDQAFFDSATGTNLAGGHAVSRTVYSPNSQILQNIDANNYTNYITYDTADRANLSIDPKGNTVACVYDQNANLTQTTETDQSDLGSPAQTFVTTRQFDSLNRLIQTTDNLSNTTFSAFDSLNNRATFMDERGNVTRYTHDGLNRLTATARFLTDTGDGAGNVTAIITTRQSWDDNSRLISQTDANGNATAYAYDALNRQTAVQFANQTTNRSSYDVHNNKTITADANGNVVTTTYDLLNRPVSKSIARGPGVEGTTFENYHYDGLSRIVQAQNDDSMVTRNYDSLSRVTRETQQTVSSGAPARTVTCVYDGVGNALSCAYPGGRVVNRSYDALNRHVLISDTLGTNAQYHYFGRSRVERCDYGNGARAVFAYDALRRMTNSQHATSGGSPIDTRAYTWDAVGNKTSMQDLLDPVQESKSFGHDSVDRLVESDKPGLGQTVAYTLDGAGNRLNDNLGSYSMDSAQPPADFQMNQYTTTPRDARTYDNNGNLLNADGTRLGGSAQKFVYDYRNRMVSASRFDGSSGYTNSFSAKYDCASRRIEKSSPGTLDRYYYSGWQEIEEQDGSDSTLATYAWGNGIDELLAKDFDGSRYFFHADDLGTIYKITDSNGQIIQNYSYGDYGQQTVGVMRQIYNTTLFAGRRYDAETGLYYYRNRYLDPIAGRFTTRDPIGIWGDVVNLGNAYTYAGNAPTDDMDPDGDTNNYNSSKSNTANEALIDPFRGNNPSDPDYCLNHPGHCLPTTNNYNSSKSNTANEALIDPFRGNNPSDPDYCLNHPGHCLPTTNNYNSSKSNTANEALIDPFRGNNPSDPDYCLNHPDRCLPTTNNYNSSKSNTANATLTNNYNSSKSNTANASLTNNYNSSKSNSVFGT